MDLRGHVARRDAGDLGDARGVGSFEIEEDDLPLDRIQLLDEFAQPSSDCCRSNASSESPPPANRRRRRGSPAAANWRADAGSHARPPRCARRDTPTCATSNCRRTLRSCARWRDGCPAADRGACRDRPHTSLPAAPAQRRTRRPPPRTTHPATPSAEVSLRMR